MLGHGPSAQHVKLMQLGGQQFDAMERSLIFVQHHEEIIAEYSDFATAHNEAMQLFQIEIDNARLVTTSQLVSPLVMRMRLSLERSLIRCSALPSVGFDSLARPNFYVIKPYRQTFYSCFYSVVVFV